MPLPSIADLVIAFWHWTTHDAVSFYTAVLAVSTILLWSATWRGIRNQSRQTRILQRAYLSVEARGIEQASVDRSDRMVALVALRNVGRLPARNVSWSASIGYPDNPAKLPIGTAGPGKAVLPPGTEMVVRTDDVLFADKAGNSTFVCGIVTYEDGFGNSRFTKFCHVYATKAFVGGHEPSAFRASGLATVRLATTLTDWRAHYDIRRL
jgi:hypothetical protein